MNTNKVDVHIIVYENSNENGWLDICLESLKDEPINLYIIEASTPLNENFYAKHRYEGYTKGSAPYVSYVDADDYIVPGTYEKCLKEIQKLSFKYDGVCTRERIYYQEENRMNHVLSAMHHLHVFRRNKNFNMVLEKSRNIKWCSDKFIMANLNIKDLPFMGYVWRKHRKGLHHYTDKYIRNNKIDIKSL